jgi:hypothetical protein
MTPFEIAMLSLMALIAVTGIANTTIPEEVSERPQWYVYTVLVFMFTAGIALINTVLGVFHVRF